MALNQYMHSRNLYRTPPDFKELAIKFPEFRAHAKQELCGKVSIDFKDPDAVRILTATLLKKDFDLNVEIPRDRLIPTVPLRLNYILWIEDLLAALPPSNIQESGILGLDIGTGSTCIYPLLGSRKNGWSFIATDSDTEALALAQKNVEANNLQDKITVLKASEDCLIEGVVEESTRQVDFTMCNPPFYKNDMEATWNSSKCRTPSRTPPQTSSNRPCTTEAVTEGGEVSFVTKMLKESEKLKDRVRIYTTMFGKKQSLTSVTKILKGMTIAKGGKINFATSEFCQGKTMRWGIAWTFLPDVDLSQVAPSVRKPKLSPPQSYIVQRSITMCSYDLSAIIEKIEEFLVEIQIKFTELKKGKDHFVLQFSASSNTWSNQRKKRRALLRQQMLSSELDDEPHAKRVCLPVETSATTSSEETVNESSKAKLEVCPDETTEIATTSNLQPAVEGLLCLRKVSENIVLELQWIKGFLGKDSVQQILQYLKNKIK